MAGMNQIIQEPELDARFKRDGYLRVGILDDFTVQQLRKLYEETRHDHEIVAAKNPFHSTQDTSDSELIKKVDSKAKEVLNPLVNDHFKDFKLLTANFLVKEPGPESVLHPHQDWNFVDESQSFSFNLWIPLEPTDKTNGCLRFLPGSHRITPTVRANDRYPWAFQHVIDLLESRLVDVPTNKGECVLLDHSVVHGSYANMTNVPRVALVLGICPKYAELRHYVSSDGRTLSIYRLLPDQIRNLRKGERPFGAELMETRPFIFPMVSKERMADWFREQG